MGFILFDIFFSGSLFGFPDHPNCQCKRFCLMWYEHYSITNGFYSIWHFLFLFTFRIPWSLKLAIPAVTFYTWSAHNSKTMVFIIDSISYNSHSNLGRLRNILFPAQIYYFGQIMTSIEFAITSHSQNPWVKGLIRVLMNKVAKRVGLISSCDDP